MSVTIKFRRGTASQWTTNGSTVLASGEPGYEIDSGRFKIGNGIVAWSGLPYASVIPSGFIAGSGINIGLGTNGSTATISVSGLNSSYIGDFNEAVDDRIGSGLFAAGTGINLNYNDAGNSFTVSVTGLISNPTNNRILTSRDNTTTGIDAETNLTFDGSLLSVSGNLIANTGTLDILQLDTVTVPVSAQGQIGWNDTFGTVDVALTNTAIVEIGEHQLYRVRNTTNNTLYKGQAVYASGVHGNGLILPNLYTANGTVAEIRFMGLIYENINNNNNGYVLNFGHIYNIDTRGNVASNIAVGDETWSTGDILYVHPTVAGKLTKVAPQHGISVALILDAANNGKIFVRPTNRGELDEIHDVNISGATNGQFLQYNSATDYWVPSSSGNFTILLVNGTGVSVSGHTHTASQITDFNEAVDDRIGSGLFVAGTGINLTYNDSANSFTVSATGLIANPGNNRILTSRDSTTTGIDAENNATFDGTTLAVSGAITVDNLRLDGNTLSSTNSNGNIIIQPSGTGALQRDGGGDARGQYAVDWQTVRASGSQVAGGNYSVIGGGRNNTVSVNDSTIGGGFNNSVSGTYSGFSTIGGGASNSVSGSNSGYCAIGGGGGNSVSGSNSGYCAIGGGGGNSVSGNYSYNCTIGGGSSNSVSGNNSGYCAIGGGSNNSVSGNGSNNCAIGGGNSNSVSGNYSSYCAIGGGSDNSVSGNTSAYCIIGGGRNNAVTGTSSTYGTIGGGYGNVISSTSTIGATIAGGGVNNISSSYANYCTIGGGNSNYISGDYSTNSTICGGSNNTITGNYSDYSTIGGGSVNNIGNSAISSTIGGGNSNYIHDNATYSVIPGGNEAKTTRYSELSHSAGSFIYRGDAQHTILIARTATTNATANQVLFLDGSSARLTIPAETTWTFSVKLSAYNDTDNQGAWWIFRGGIRRNASNGTALIGSIITESGAESTLSTASASIVADDTNDALEIRVTGVASKNIRWVAVVDISQVSYGTP